ncbi:hypothetical protein B0T24DRAFT_643797 [Lasiosphaeria ovina]|uniref:Uncharacterized protein n=1 Tax=Lasiosphaeria ovina TaxID=92902 RepID=A0AAE0JRX5_9PEZI|nr:hypothetical protein B0T24DRAFT_643797 [Lasiosphaeria ovina]
MTQSLCRTLDRFQDGGAQTLSVQNLCSHMREDLRQTETDTDTDLATRVFVTQLGGGQLLDIYLPRL